MSEGPNPPSNGTYRRKRAVISALAILTLAKLLFLPSSVYRSTDFDVHRNWLAVTRNLPLSQWYFDNVNGTTVHTLDYPPLFALFEAALSRNPLTSSLLNHGLLDARCLELLGDHENEPSDACVAFHRLTVVLADVVLYAGAFFASASVLGGGVGGASGEAGSGDALECRAFVSAALIVLNPGLLLLDHIHFQYNGMLLGLLLLSIGCIAQGARLAPGDWDGLRWDVAGAVLYAALLTMKHLYLTLAPLYFFYLLRHCCFEAKGIKDPENGGTLDQRGKRAALASFSIKNFLVLASVTALTLALPFVPFLVGPTGPVEQLGQMFRRLFPFQRGLCHDYWAANIWALYLFGEKVVGFVLRRAGVQSLGFPDVPPSIAALCLLAGLIPAMIYAWRAASSMLELSGLKLSSGVAMQERRSFFVHSVVFCSFSGFMLAYHVHEKAIMTAIIPLTLMATQSRDHAQLYLRTCALGHFGLFPLLFRPAELAFKATSYVSFLALAVLLLESTVFNCNQGVSWVIPNGQVHGLVTKWDRLGLGVLALVFVFVEIIHPLFLQSYEKLEFLPLMVTSIVCAVGLVGCWAHSLVLMYRNVHEISSVSTCRTGRREKKTL